MKLAARTTHRYCEGAVTRLSRPPHSSFGHGAAGVSFFLHRSSSINGDAATLDRAAEWAAVAERSIDDPGAFASPPPVFPDARTAPSSSVLFGEAGVWWVSTLVHDALGNATGADRAVSRFALWPPPAPTTGSTSPPAPQVSSSPRRRSSTSPPERILPVGDDLARRLEQAIEEPRPSPGWVRPTGGAGSPTLLAWCRATRTKLSPVLATLLGAPPETRLAAGVWPRRHETAEVWPGWCHGSAGWAQLWVLAAEVLGEDGLLDLAERPTVHAILGRGAGAGLCCGMAGQAYAAAAMVFSRRRLRPILASLEAFWVAKGRCHALQSV